MDIGTDELSYALRTGTRIMGGSAAGTIHGSG
jgi:hypothetical protein